MPPAADAPLAAWLDWIDGVHPSEMELGLGRVSRVAARLGLDRPPLVVATVGGTNGKGSTVAMLEAIWTAAGHRTGAATSPHVTRFNERVRVAGEEADDATLARAFARIEAGRGADTLTYFEFATLASMAVFVEAGCDVAIMEVGLGGRLDAVNLWDADCAVLTSIALDHADWLGTDLAVIATEKAAIARPGRPLVVGETAPPASLRAYVDAHAIRLIDVGARPPETLPRTSLAGAHQRRNAACALAAADALADVLPVEEAVARAALMHVAVVARFEERVVRGAAGEAVTLVVDVAHNPAGAAALARTWQGRFGGTRGVAVFAALADKDVEGIVEALAPHVAHWCLAALAGARATPTDVLAARVRGALGEPAPVETFDSVERALERALALASTGALPVLACGSFVTVTAVHAALAG